MTSADNASEVVAAMPLIGESSAGIHRIDNTGTDQLSGGTTRISR